MTFPMLLMTASLISYDEGYAVVRVSGRVKRNADVLAPAVVSSNLRRREDGSVVPDMLSGRFVVVLNSLRITYFSEQSQPCV